MNPNEIKAAVSRILKGERATLVVKASNEQAARQVLASLSPRLQSLLTIQVVA